MQTYKKKCKNRQNSSFKMTEIQLKLLNLYENYLLMNKT